LLVILATQEADIRRIAIQSQPGEIICKTLSWKNPLQKKGWWSGSRYRPKFKPQYLKKFKIKIKNIDFYLGASGTHL
jgi:hypothetical protein